MTQQVSATDTIQNLQDQLRDAILEAYQAKEQLETAKGRITTLQTALNGVQLGQNVAQETAAASADTGEYAPEEA